MRKLNQAKTTTSEASDPRSDDSSFVPQEGTYPKRTSVGETAPESAKNPDDAPTPAKTAIISHRAAIIIAVAVLVATFSIRDLIFLAIGVAACGGFILYTQAAKLDQKNAKTRIIIYFKDLKRDFDRLLQKADMVHVNRNYFINNYSKGLYHQLAFEEQLDIVKWVEEVEMKLQNESMKQFRDFEKSITEIEDLNSSRLSAPEENPLLRQSTAPVQSLTEPVKDSGAQPSSKITVELSLRDMTEQLNKIEKLSIKSLDEKHFKALVNDVKAVMQDFFKTNEEVYSLWGHTNGHAFDRLRKIFNSSPVPNSPQYNMFGLSLDLICTQTPNLFTLGSMTKFMEKSGVTLGTRMIFDYEWDLVKEKFIAGKEILSERNQATQKEVEEAIAKNQEELAAKIGRTSANIKKLKEYFNGAKSKLATIQQEFNTRMVTAKAKIEDFKKNFDNRQEYEVQLKLEYEIRLDISKLYSLKHSHESECASLERRISELGIFNTNTQLLHSLMENQVMRFVQICEEKLLGLLKLAAATRLCELLAIDESTFKPEDQAKNSIQNILDMYSLKISFPVNDESFKSFLSSCMIAEDLDTVHGRSTTKEIKAIQLYVEKVKAEIQKAKDAFKDLQLDANNEFDEGIVIGKVPEARITLKSINSIGDMTQNSVLDHSSNSDGNASKADWTSNKIKAHKLQDLLEKNVKSMEAIYEVYQQEFKLITASEGRLNKLISSQNDKKLKELLFRSLARSYSGRRLCLQDLVQKLHTLLQLTAGLKWEVDWLLRTVYGDDKNDKLMSQTTKKAIFKYLQILKACEVSAKAMIIESICSHQFREYQIVQLLQSDKYVGSDATMMEDILEQQKLIRRGATNQLFSDETGEAVPGSKKKIETSPRNL